ncbi:DUF3606 domain-containing protein [Mesoflavibacter zeaxanthinifaciens]|uniref:DUF3606 domain-containing protein n=1 Tax=Mesoflavibacter zeaxanthinifaciens TaxID=393060 RepID=UPI003A92958B
MPDNPKKKGPRDDKRISTQPHEIQYWKKKLNVSGQQLAGAKKATGSTSVKVIKEYLKNKKK